ncbi:hypothetical protein DBR36_01055, partial [Microbacterium sp. HMWF026]
MALREIASELAAAQRLSNRTVQAHIGRAMQIVDDLPVTLAAWGSGALTRAHVRAIADVVSTLPEERSAEFDAIAASLGPQLSPGRLRARLAAVAEKLQPTTLSERHRRGRETRCVRIVTGVDGMSDLIATLPTVLAVGIYDRLTQQSRSLIDAREQGAGAVLCGSGGGSGGGVGAVGADGADSTAEGIPGDDERTTDQIRADILTDLLLTTAPSLDPTRADDGAGGLGAIRARVQV